MCNCRLNRTSGLKRITPLRSKTQLRPGRAKLGKSDEQKAEDEALRSVVAEYLRRHPVCHHCLELSLANPLPSNTVHHVARRAGGLLLDPRFFMAVNDQCHVMNTGSIHANEAYSRERGWIISQHLSLEDKLAILIELRGHLSYVRMYLEMKS